MSKTSLKQSLSGEQRSGSCSGLIKGAGKGVDADSANAPSALYLTAALWVEEKQRWRPDNAEALHQHLCIGAGDRKAEEDKRECSGRVSLRVRPISLR
jgi:hypothetical protein